LYTQIDLQRDITHALKKQNLKDKLHLRNSKMDSIKITPSVSFYYGTPEHPIQHITSGRGRLLGNGLISIANLIGSATATYSGGVAYFWMQNFAVGSSGVPLVPSIRLGVGTTATAYNTTQLANIISTAPNTVSGSISNPSTGTYLITLNATWNAGTLGTPTITEAGLYAFGEFTLQSFGATYANCVTDTIALVDRICSADGDFTAFTVNASYPVTVAYPIQIAYA
jgi:hypothetical protein